MAATNPHEDILFIWVYIMRRIAWRAAKDRLQNQLGYPPPRELIEAEADLYMSREKMANLLAELHSKRPPGIEAPLLVQGAQAALFGCAAVASSPGSHRTIDL